MDTPTSPKRRLYGRASGPRLRARPQGLVTAFYPECTVPQDGLLDAPTLFGPDIKGLGIEIGFGKGEHIYAQAQAHPDIGWIGCEPYLNGMAALLGLMHEDRPDNLRVYRGDAHDILERLPDAALDWIFLLHPDPWPKHRHAKRRFVNDETIGLCVRKMKPGARFRVGTDHPLYLRWTLMVMARHLQWQAERPVDWHTRPSDWPATRYEQWALGEGRPVWYLEYAKI